MRYVAAYLLAVLGGNDKPTEKDLKKIISSVGVDADSDAINKVINELKGKVIDDVIKAGKCILIQSVFLLYVRIMYDSVQKSG